MGIKGFPVADAAFHSHLVVKLEYGGGVEILDDPIHPMAAGSRPLVTTPFSLLV